MTFNEYINLIGIEKFAKMHNVVRGTVYAWLDLSAVPRAELAYKIIVLSNGVLTWEKIYQPYAEKQLKGQKIQMPLKDGAQLEFTFKS